MNNLHRIFLAINLPERVRQALFDYQDQWLDLPANWTRKENLHVTLLFIGNASDQETADICNAVSAVAKRHEPLTLDFKRIVYGPPKKVPPRMVWAKGSASAELAGLRQDLEHTLYDLGAGQMEKNGVPQFSPHITLARINQFEIRKMDPEEVPGIDENISISFTAESIEVMESELKKGGPVYTVLESATLGTE
ncbi:MAG TPA: RNA 2',3'-cyclic phosphodiesterase [Candidatus Paceibacterota bacterium]|nr:RNA 2',3'-cyclic phosphodiesterase [Candidatus Pacearchaeota archaeon]HRZ51274.1 RNA 2',3'-cyclic phosphodiesterase [Candidatus Paceibacterota bacterium]HSA36996.1 RNA 2',3'-cyclic phosphodiesterase [Candidatus Paceibacterota bacterium]